LKRFLTLGLFCLRGRQRPICSQPVRKLRFSREAFRTVIFLVADGTSETHAKSLLEGTRPPATSAGGRARGQLRIHSPFYGLRLPAPVEEGAAAVPGVISGGPETQSAAKDPTGHADGEQGPVRRPPTKPKDGAPGKRRRVSSKDTE